MCTPAKPAPQECSQLWLCLLKGMPKPQLGTSEPPMGQPEEHSSKIGEQRLKVVTPGPQFPWAPFLNLFSPQSPGMLGLHRSNSLQDL